MNWTGLLWCFYQLFGVSFWRHPFTVEDPLWSKWWNAKFLQICSYEEAPCMAWEIILKSVNFLFGVNCSFNRIYILLSAYIIHTPLFTACSACTSTELDVELRCDTCKCEVVILVLGYGWLSRSFKTKLFMNLTVFSTPNRADIRILPRCEDLCQTWTDLWSLPLTCPHSDAFRHSRLLLQ